MEQFWAISCSIGDSLTCLSDRAPWRSWRTPPNIHMVSEKAEYISGYKTTCDLSEVSILVTGAKAEGNFMDKI